MRNWISAGCSLLVVLWAPLSASAQSQHTAKPLGTTGAPYGYYEYLPDGYDSGTGEWPVVLFLHGMGEAGNGTSELSRVLNLGVPKNIDDGDEYPFIVISPQTVPIPPAMTVDPVVAKIWAR